MSKASGIVLIAVGIGVAVRPLRLARFQAIEIAKAIRRVEQTHFVHFLVGESFHGQDFHRPHGSSIKLD
jgi:hypothetical protein